MPALCLVFTVPERIFNDFLCNSSSCDGGGQVWSIWDTTLLFLDPLPYLSRKVDKCLISSDCALISSVCQRCRCDRTNTWVRCAISSSIMSASSISFPCTAWALANSSNSEALLCTKSCCKPWALTTFYPIPSSMSLRASACLFGTGIHLFGVHAGREDIYNTEILFSLALGSNPVLSYLHQKMELCHECQLN